MPCTGSLIPICGLESVLGAILKQPTRRARIGRLRNTSRMAWENRGYIKRRLGLTISETNPPTALVPTAIRLLGATHRLPRRLQAEMMQAGFLRVPASRDLAARFVASYNPSSCFPHCLVGMCGLSRRTKASHWSSQGPEYDTNCSALSVSIQNKWGSPTAGTRRLH